LAHGFGTVRICNIKYSLQNGYFQGCNVAGRRGNGVSTPFSRFALKWILSCYKWLSSWMRSHTFFVSTTSLIISSHLSQKPMLRKNFFETVILSEDI